MIAAARHVSAAPEQKLTPFAQAANLLPVRTGRREQGEAASSTADGCLRGIEPCAEPNEEKR